MAHKRKLDIVERPDAPVEDAGAGAGAGAGPPGVALCAWCDCPYQNPYIFPAKFAGFNHREYTPYGFCSAECALAHVQSTSPHVEVVEWLRVDIQTECRRTVNPCPPYVLSTTYGGAIPPEGLRWQARGGLTEAERALAALEDEYHTGIVPPAQRFRPGRTVQDEDQLAGAAASASESTPPQPPPASLPADPQEPIHDDMKS